MFSRTATGTTQATNPANSRADKFEREKHLLLLLDNMLDQMKNFSMDNERAVDFIAISESLPKQKGGHPANNFTSPKTLIKLWDSLKKKLRDPNKRENEFQALCRNEVSVDFWTDLIQSGQFKARMKVYRKELPHIEKFSQQEARFN